MNSMVCGTTPFVPQGVAYNVSPSQPVARPN